MLEGFLWLQLWLSLCIWSHWSLLTLKLFAVIYSQSFRVSLCHRTLGWALVGVITWPIAETHFSLSQLQDKWQHATFNHKKNWSYDLSDCHARIPNSGNNHIDAHHIGQRKPNTYRWISWPLWFTLIYFNDSQNFVQTFTVPRGWIIKTSINLWHFI